MTQDAEPAAETVTYISMNEMEHEVHVGPIVIVLGRGIRRVREFSLPADPTPRMREILRRLQDIERNAR